MPGAQPADLGGQPLSSIFSPPGAPGSSGPTLAQYLAGQQGPTTMPGVQGSAQPAPAPMPTPTPQPNQGPTGPSQDQLLAAFGQPGGPGGQQPPPPDQQSQVNDLLNAFGPPPTTPKKGDQFDDTAPQSWGEMWQRMKASLGRNPTEVASVLQSSYGDDNVRIRGDKVYFRKPGETKFRALDPKQFEFFGDLFADMGGNMVEAAGAAPLEAAGTRIGSGLATTGPAGMAAGAGVAAGGFAAGAGMGLSLRESALGWAGGRVDPSVNELTEYQKSLSTNLATAGVGKIVGGALGKISTAIAESPIMRLKSIATVQAAIEDMANAYRIGSSGTPESTGGLIRSVVQRERARLNGFVEASRSLVENSAGDTKFPVQNTLTSLKTILKDQGVAFDKDGTALLSGSMADEAVPIVRQVDRASPVLGADGKPIVTQEMRPDVVRVPGQPVEPPVAPLGTPGGGGELREMVDMYNQLSAAQKNGGVDARALFRMTSDLGDRGEYQVGQKLGVTKAAASKVSSRWRAVNAGAIADRDQAAVFTLPADSPELAAYKSAMAHYSDRIDGVKRLEKLVQSADTNGSLPTLADSVIHPNAPETIRQFKQIVGDSPTNDLHPDQTWETVRGSWLSTLVNSPSVKDPISGVISGKKLMSTLDKYGKDVLNEVFDNGEIGQMRKMATKLDSIYKGDLKPSAVTQAFLDMEPVWDRFVSSRSIANFMWGMTSQRAELADNLLDEGFMQMYRKAAPQNRAKIIGAMNQFQNMYDLSIKTTAKNGLKKLTLPSTYLQQFGLAVGRGAQTGVANQVRQGTGATFKDIQDQIKGLKGDAQDALGFSGPATQPTQ